LAEKVVTTKKKTEVPKCPLCGSNVVVPIVYGLPDAELAEASEKGEVELGGCVIMVHDPKWRCKECGHGW
jgi:DNA-directed RNA polymerase subunit RPC12/RpoP